MLDDPLINIPLEKQTKGASILSSSLNLTNTVIGAGLLCLPSAMMHGGLGLGLSLLLVVCLLASSSFIFLSSCCSKTGQYSYKGIAKSLLGRRYGSVVELFVFLYTCGTCIGYNVLIGDFLPSSLPRILPESAPDFLTNRTYLIILAAALVLLPLSLLPKLDALRYTSAAALVCALYLVCMVVYRYVTGTYEVDSPGPVVYWDFSPKMFLAIPLMAVSFTAHYNVPNLYKELHNRSPKRFAAVVFISVTCCITLFAVIASFGYLSFTNKTDGDILNNYHDDLLADIARAGLSFTLAFSYPLVCFALRRSIENMFMGEPEAYWPRQALLATIITVCAVSVAILEERITVVLGISGSTAGQVIVFILPGIFYLKATSLELPSCKRTISRLIAFLMVVVGLIFMVMCTYHSVINMLKGGE
ncbi:hypothetical protein P9112_012781 [Eukaryota sp. TZLM1-RC]